MEEKGYFSFSISDDEFEIVHEQIYADGRDEIEEFKVFINLEDMRNNNFPNSMLMLDVEGLDLENLNDYMFDGKFPMNLRIINCSHNKLIDLPVLPLELIALNCSHNIIQELPESIDYCSELKTLSCNDNQLSELRIPKPFVEDFDSWEEHGDEEDIKLEYLNCSNNKLTKLPDENPLADEFSPNSFPNKLPNTLEVLICNNNNLDSLPELLPARLIYLSCTNNNITSLPIQEESLYSWATLNNLNMLYCNNNNINELPFLPRNLTNLNCSNNNMTKITAFPPNLKTINCSDNKLTNLPTFPNTLRNLYYIGNDFDDKTTNNIIAFYENAIKKKYIQFPSTPTYKELLNHILTYRARVFSAAFTGEKPEFSQFPREPGDVEGRTAAGQMIVKDGKMGLSRHLPRGIIDDILERAGLPVKKIGGKTIRKLNKRKTSTKKNTKRITKRKTLIKNKSRRNKKN